MTSKLLIDEPPIAITPSLIRCLGGHDLACFAQQVHYLAQSHLAQDLDGHRWAVATADEWGEMVVLTAKQLRRVLERLVALGVVVRHQPEGSYDRTAWTRIDYDCLERLNGQYASRPNGHYQPGPKRPDPSGPNGHDVPTTKRTKRTTKNSAASVDAPSMALELHDGTAPPPEPELTVNQRAQRIQQAFWIYVAEQTRKPPVSVNPVALQRLVARFLTAEFTDREVKGAIRTLWDAGRPLLAATIEAELHGRRSRAPRPNVQSDLAGMQFDDAGNLIGQ